MPAAELTRAAGPANALIEERLHAGGEVRFTIASASMWPTLAPGDEVRVRGAAGGEARPGDIVFWRAGEVWLAHRLIARSGSGAAAQLITKGDNSPRPDPAWPAGRLCGVVAGARRGGQEWRPARWPAVVLAGLSRAQAAVWRPQPGPLRRAAVKSVGLALRAGAAFSQGGFARAW